jgi:hypothetical protein
MKTEVNQKNNVIYKYNELFKCPRIPFAATFGLSFLTASRQGISKDHQLSMAQDQKTFEKTQNISNLADFLQHQLFIDTFYSFWSHFLDNV